MEEYVSFSEFNGHPVITLKDEYDLEHDKSGFSFGLKKARLVLEHLGAIRDFVESNSKGK